MQAIKCQGTHFVIMGNININLQKYNLENNVTEYLNKIISASCTLAINKATRVRNGWQSCLDPV